MALMYSLVDLAATGIPFCYTWHVDCSAV